MTPPDSPPSLSISGPAWIERSTPPADGQLVICLEDLRGFGRTYVGMDLYYYRSGIGFVANPTDDDAYGGITHWMPLYPNAQASATASWHELVSAQLLWEYNRGP